MYVPANDRIPGLKRRTAALRRNAEAVRVAQQQVANATALAKVANAVQA